MADPNDLRLSAEARNDLMRTRNKLSGLADQVEDRTLRWVLQNAANACDDQVSDLWGTERDMEWTREGEAAE